MQIVNRRMCEGERGMAQEGRVTRCCRSDDCRQVYMQSMCGGRGLQRSNRRCVQFPDMYGLWVRGPPAVS